MGDMTIEIKVTFTDGGEAIIPILFGKPRTPQQHTKYINVAFESALTKIGQLHADRELSRIEFWSAT